MKVAKVRVGEKFVLDDRGGVWEKLEAGSNGDVRARCFFGPRSVYGTEIIVDPNAYCYVIFEGREKPFGKDYPDRREDTPVAPVLPAVAGAINIVIVTEDDQVLVDIPNATMAQLIAFSTAEEFKLTPPGKRNPRGYSVSEIGYDADKNVYGIAVRENGVIGKEGDKE